MPWPDHDELATVLRRPQSRAILDLGVSALRGLSTCDVLDAHPEFECLGDRYRSFGGVASFAGHVRTVSCREDNSALRSLVNEQGEGRVLVADGGASLRVALLGERMARQAHESGWAGLIVEGAVRDVVALRRIPIGIAALGATPRRSEKNGRSRADVLVAVEGVVIEPGDFVWVDPDGVVVASGHDVGGISSRTEEQ